MKKMLAFSQFFDGEKAHPRGSVVEIPDADAARMEFLGLAKYVDDPAPSPASAPAVESPAPRVSKKKTTRGK